MSLKKPKEVPKIPKAREKSIEKLKKATPEKKPDELEYHCKIYFHKDKISGTQKYRIQVETIKQFSFLNYKLTVQDQKNKNEIDISLLGLNATNDYVTKVQPASAEVDYENLFGEHTINILKQDGSMNAVIVNFNAFKKEIELIKDYVPEKKNNRRFCSFEIAKDLFTFSKEYLK